MVEFFPRNRLLVGCERVADLRQQLGWVIVWAHQSTSQGRLASQLQVALEHRVVIEQAKGALMERDLIDAATAFERLRGVARSGQHTVAEVAREVLAGMPLPVDPAEGTQPTGKPAVIAYQQAAGLHERLAALYELLGHPNRARQEWQQAVGARTRAEGPSASRAAGIHQAPHRDPDVLQWRRHLSATFC